MDIHVFYTPATSQQSSGVHSIGAENGGDPEAIIPF
jgi:hypothetical protein